jgi:hypothetical protein
MRLGDSLVAASFCSPFGELVDLLFVPDSGYLTFCHGFLVLGGQHMGIPDELVVIPSPSGCEVTAD